MTMTPTTTAWAPRSGGRRGRSRTPRNGDGDGDGDGGGGPSSGTKRSGSGGGKDDGSVGSGRWNGRRGLSGGTVAPPHRPTHRPAPVRTHGDPGRSRPLPLSGTDGEHRRVDDGAAPTQDSFLDRFGESSVFSGYSALKHGRRRGDGDDGDTVGTFADDDTYDPSFLGVNRGRLRDNDDPSLLGGGATVRSERRRLRKLRKSGRDAVRIGFGLAFLASYVYFQTLGTRDVRTEIKDRMRKEDDVSAAGMLAEASKSSQQRRRVAGAGGGGGNNTKKKKKKRGGGGTEKRTALRPGRERGNAAGGGGRAPNAAAPRVAAVRAPKNLFGDETQQALNDAPEGDDGSDSGVGSVGVIVEGLEKISAPVASAALENAGAVEKYDASPGSIAIPTEYETRLADLTDPYPPGTTSTANDGAGAARDLPFFWHVPKSGGTTLKHFLGFCSGLTLATESGASDPDWGKAEELRSVKMVDGANGETVRYVNVDVSTEAGLMRAKRLKLATSGLSGGGGRLCDAAVSPEIRKGLMLFNPNDGPSGNKRTVKGRMFALFRDPVKRAVSTFKYLQRATWEPTYTPRLASMTLLQYAQSQISDDDWMVRMLVNRNVLGWNAQGTGGVTGQDLEVAKEILRRKCLVGLMDEMEESVGRFERYFGWDTLNEKGGECRERMLKGGTNRNGSVNGNGGDGKKRASPPGARDNEDQDPEYQRAIALLRKKNGRDVALYEYALRLFEEQGALFFADAIKERRRTAPYGAAGTGGAKDTLPEAGRASAGGAAATAVGRQKTEEKKKPSELSWF